jgi:hypothetical protein
VGAADADHPRGVLRERPGQPLTLARSGRFSSQALAGPALRSPVAVAERLLAVQAQDPRGFRLAVRARSVSRAAADVDAALDAGALVVSWLNRGTLHLVTPEDYWLLQGLTAPRLVTGNAARLAQEGVPPADADRGVAAVVRALADGPLPRSALRSAVAAAGVRVEGQALVHVLVLASLRGLVVRGPVVGREQAYVLVADWLGAPPPFDRAIALGELARRYLAGHGPANDRDLAKWAGLPLRDARAGLAAVRTVDAGDGLVALRSARADLPEPVPRLLGAFDPVLCGWASREWVLGPHEATVVSGGLYRPFALVDGRAVATWRLSPRGRVEVTPFADFDPSVLDGEVRAVESYGL